MKNNNVIWLLIDDRKGNSSQVFGVAKYIKSKNIINKNIVYNKLTFLPNFLLLNNIPHVNKKYKLGLKPPWPKLVIGCGRRSAAIGLWIKKQSQNYSKYIQIMWPSYPYKNIDLIFTPAHDNILKKNNVVNIFSSPNVIDDKLLKINYEKWKNTFKLLSSPKITVLIGGDTKNNQFTSNHIKILMNHIKLLHTKLGGSLLITTSRRTSLECFIQIKKELKDLANNFILWGPHMNTNNPYFGMLSHSDLIVVTGDSMSICSEAAATGKPVLIFSPEDITSKKHKKFHKLLIENNIAKYIEKFSINEINDFNHKPVNESKKIAKIIMNKFL